MDRQLREPPAPSWRKPAGVLLILALLALWSVAVVWLVEQVGPLHPLIELPLYVLAGVLWLWLLPMRRLLAWMELGSTRSVDRSR